MLSILKTSVFSADNNRMEMGNPEFSTTLPFKVACSLKNAITLFLASISSMENVFTIP